MGRPEQAGEVDHSDQAGEALVILAGEVKQVGLAGEVGRLERSPEVGCEGEAD